MPWDVLELFWTPAGPLGACDGYGYIYNIHPNLKLDVRG
jgi:hypothetical protein